MNSQTYVLKFDPRLFFRAIIALSRSQCTFEKQGSEAHVKKNLSFQAKKVKNIARLEYDSHDKQHVRERNSQLYLTITIDISISNSYLDTPVVLTHS